MATSIEEVVMNIRYRVALSEVERGVLRTMLGGSKYAARKPERPRILLAADAGVADETDAISLDWPARPSPASSDASSRAARSGRFGPTVHALPGTGVVTSSISS
jgi:hypothetical protein